MKILALILIFVGVDILLFSQTNNIKVLSENLTDKEKKILYIGVCNSLSVTSENTTIRYLLKYKGEFIIPVANSNYFNINHPSAESPNIDIYEIKGNDTSFIKTESYSIEKIPQMEIYFGNISKSGTAEDFAKQKEIRVVFPGCYYIFKYIITNCDIVVVNRYKQKSYYENFTSGDDFHNNLIRKIKKLKGGDYILVSNLKLHFNDGLGRLLYPKIFEVDYPE